MRQLTCIGPGRLEWRDVPEPRLASDDDAVVRPLAVARCDIDLPLTSGIFPIREPFALGHECVAEITALGDRVRGLEIGQRVVVAFQVSCGSVVRNSASGSKQLHTQARIGIITEDRVSPSDHAKRSWSRCGLG